MDFGRNGASSGPAKEFGSLAQETRSTVDTATAAHYLNRRMQTLQKWSSQGTGPLTPIRLNGRLSWPVGEIKKLMGVAQ